MDTTQDYQFRTEAINLLDSNLKNCNWSLDDNNSDIDKDLLIEMYRDSQLSLQINMDDYDLRKYADSTFEQMRWSWSTSSLRVAPWSSAPNLMIRLQVLTTLSR